MSDAPDGEDINLSVCVGDEIFDHPQYQQFSAEFASLQGELNQKVEDKDARIQVLESDCQKYEIQIGALIQERDHFKNKLKRKRGGQSSSDSDTP